MIGMTEPPLHDLFRIVKLWSEAVLRLSVNYARDESEVMN